MQRIKGLSWCLVVLLAVVSLAACQEDILPQNRSDAAFTLYGFFNPLADTQAVRIYEVEPLLDTVRPEPIDATVSSLDITSGETRVWSDSLKKFILGPYAHFFYSPFRAEYDHTYRIVVERLDGAKVEATATVPPYTEPAVIDPDPGEFELLTPVFYPGAPNLIDIRVRYHSNVGVFEWDYGVEQGVRPDGRQVNVQFRRDTRDILVQALINRVRDPKIFRVEIFAVVTDSEWAPPDGMFDPNFLVEPGSFSNVEGGFGFVSAGYQTVVEWIPEDAVLDVAGFMVE